MKRVVLALPFVVAFFGLGACSKQANDNDAIRAGILQHLTPSGTLNMNAMDTDMRSVSVTGNQAEIEFRPETGDAPGTGMNVAYDLEKRGVAWVVLKTQPLGGAMQHPHTNQSSNANQPVHSMPNFNELLNPPAAPGQAALRSGHPPASAESASPSASQDQPSTKKPQ